MPHLSARCIFVVLCHFNIFIALVPLEHTRRQPPLCKATQNSAGENFASALKKCGEIPRQFEVRNFPHKPRRRIAPTPYVAAAVNRRETQHRDKRERNLSDEALAMHPSPPYHSPSLPFTLRAFPCRRTQHRCDLVEFAQCPEPSQVHHPSQSWQTGNTCASQHGALRLLTHATVRAHKDMLWQAHQCSGHSGCCWPVMKAWHTLLCTQCGPRFLTNGAWVATEVCKHYTHAGHFGLTLEIFRMIFLLNATDLKTHLGSPVDHVTLSAVSDVRCGAFFCLARRRAPDDASVAAQMHPRQCH